MRLQLRQNYCGAAGPYSFLCWQEVETLNKNSGVESTSILRQGRGIVKTQGELRDIKVTVRIPRNALVQFVERTQESA